MAIEAEPQEILDFIKRWVQAVNLCTETLPKLTAQGLLDSVTFFEEGGRYLEGFTPRKDTDRR